MLMKKGPRFLRFIIFYKTAVGVVEVLLAVMFLRLPEKNLEVLLTNTLKDHNLDTGNRLMDFAVKKAGLLHEDLVFNITIIVLVFGILNLIESYGLHLRRRWAEWLTVAGTSALIPYEFYELVTGFSALKFWVLAINSAIVYYLVKHQEVFKGRRVIL